MSEQPETKQLLKLFGREQITEYAKTAKGHSRLSINPKTGEISYSAPWVTAANRKPFKLSPLKPRVDKLEAWLKRIRGHVKPTSKTPGTPASKVVGQRTADGFVVDATDGYRALMFPGSTGETCAALPTLDDSFHRVALPPEFHLALRRALTISDNVYLVGEPGLVELSSFHKTEEERGNDDCEFRECLAVPSPADWRVCVDGDYLEVICGIWPLVMWVKDETHAVMFEPEDRSWRYMLMPMRAVWPKEDEAVTVGEQLEKCDEPVMEAA